MERKIKERFVVIGKQGSTDDGHDFTDPKTGKSYQYFPIRKLSD